MTGRAASWPAALAALALAGAAVGAPTRPDGIRVVDGAFADPSGRPLYTWDFDTMAGMSHCRDDCAAMWPPLTAPPTATPVGDWTLVTREDGTRQWAYKAKPLYTYSADQPGQPPAGERIPRWRLAR
ncbi:MAG: hypothetical protein ACHP9T_11510 [Caulobacterales bacterium]|jgi:predicted lipoprotein with Yx(FWY)xxD motif